eukprot:5642270-Amphidinium_carterae.1
MQYWMISTAALTQNIFPAKVPAVMPKDMPGASADVQCHVAQQSYNGETIVRGKQARENMLENAQPIFV